MLKKSELTRCVFRLLISCFHVYLLFASCKLRLYNQSHRGCRMSDQSRDMTGHQSTMVYLVPTTTKECIIAWRDYAGLRGTARHPR